MSDFSAKIKAILDTSEIPKKIHDIEKNTTFTLKRFDLNTKGLPSEIQASLDKHKFTINLSGIKTTNLTSDMREAGERTGQAFSQSLIKKINTQISTKGLDASISTVTARYEKLNNTIKNLGDNTSLRNKLNSVSGEIRTLNDLNAKFKSGMSDEELVGNYEQFNQTLKRVKNTLTSISAENQQFLDPTKISSLKNKIEKWMADNPTATKKYQTTLDGYLSSLSNIDSSDIALFGEIERGFKSIDSAATSAGIKGKTFGEQLRGALTSISKYISASTIIYEVINIAKSGVQSIIELDTALVDLQKTTDATASQLKEFYFSANDTAKSLGVSTAEVIQATADWSRLGYSIQEAQTLAETSSIFAAISPEMDIDVATDGLISAIKAFDIEAEDALDGVASKVNSIGNTQAVENQDIVNVLTRSSSAMKEANNTLDETIALGTAAVEITRDAEGAGNALKTISMRIRGYDEETESYVGGVESLSGAIADLTKTAEHPFGVSLFTDESKTEYKSTTQLLRDISEIYDELTDKQQAELLEKLAGKRQGQVVAAILKNFDTVEESLDTMANSEGNALQEMDTIEQSLEYKLNALRETAVGIFQNLLQSDTIGSVVEGFTSILEAVDLATDGIRAFKEETGSFGSVLGGTALTSLVALIKNFD